MVQIIIYALALIGVFSIIHFGVELFRNESKVIIRDPMIIREDKSEPTPRKPLRDTTTYISTI